MENYYQILGIQKDDAVPTRKAVEEKLSQVKGSSQEDKETKYKINKAYEVLSDIKKKKFYDDMLPFREEFEKRTSRVNRIRKQDKVKVTSYDILDVSPKASQEEIKQHFQFLSHVYSDMPSMKKDLETAYKRIANPQERTAYDTELLKNKAYL